MDCGATYNLSPVQAVQLFEWGNELNTNTKNKLKT